MQVMADSEPAANPAAVIDGSGGTLIQPTNRGDLAGFEQPHTPYPMTSGHVVWKNWPSGRSTRS